MPGFLSVIRALAKAIDFTISFVVGFVSDKMDTKWGRRLPFIAFGSIVAPVSMWFLASPPMSLSVNEVFQGIDSQRSHRIANWHEV